jgi:hypothetical protein
MVDDTLQIKTYFPYMIIAPHARFPIWDFTAFRNIVPSIGPVIYGMQQKTLVFRIKTDIGLFKQRADYFEPCLPVTASGSILAFAF